VLIDCVEVMTFKSVRNWGPSGHRYPPDTPICGFFLELCPIIQSGQSIYDRTRSWIPIFFYCESSKF